MDGRIRSRSGLTTGALRHAGTVSYYCLFDCGEALQAHAWVAAPRSRQAIRAGLAYAPTLELARSSSSLAFAGDIRQESIWHRSQRRQRTTHRVIDARHLVHGGDLCSSQALFCGVVAGLTRPSRCLLTALASVQRATVRAYHAPRCPAREYMAPAR